MEYRPSIQHACVDVLLLLPPPRTTDTYRLTLRQQYAPRNQFSRPDVTAHTVHSSTSTKHHTKKHDPGWVSSLAEVGVLLH